MITNAQSGTSVDEIADRIYRISTPVPGFSFNQFLIADEDPLLFHTGPRKMFPLVKEAVASIIPVERLRYISFSHFEADECGSLNEWLATAGRSVPVCGRVAAMTSVEDFADRAPLVLADRGQLSLGSHTVQWLDTPHLPHAWECGFMMETSTRTFLCGDLFTQGGDNNPAITESDILEPSEALRKQMDYFSNPKESRKLLELLARLEPTTLACMHGSTWRGDGAGLLLELADRLAEG